MLLFNDFKERLRGVKTVIINEEGHTECTHKKVLSWEEINDWANSKFQAFSFYYLDAKDIKRAVKNEGDFLTSLKYSTGQFHYLNLERETLHTVSYFTSVNTQISEAICPEKDPREKPWRCLNCFTRNSEKSGICPLCGITNSKQSNKYK